MSAADASAGTPPAAVGDTNPWLNAILVALATVMEVLDTTIANVVLPYIAGGLGVGKDEASWVVTTYLVANAVALTNPAFWQVSRARGGWVAINPYRLEIKLESRLERWRIDYPQKRSLVIFDTSILRRLYGRSHRPRLYGVFGLRIEP